MMDIYVDNLVTVREKIWHSETFLPDSVFSDETAYFRNPVEPCSTDFVEIFLQAAKNNVKRAYLCTEEKTFLMRKKETLEALDRYSVLLPPTEKPVRYFFALEHINGISYYGKNGITDIIPETQWQFCILRDFITPDWAKGSVMYQIYVDRFCNGNLDNDVRTGEYCYLKEDAVGQKDWYAPIVKNDFCCFYGGDLDGVLQKLDYLADLGVEVLYLNPIFVSPSSHKYDIQDYEHIDPHFGRIVKDGALPSENIYQIRTTSKENLEASDALFAELVEKAHQKGIRILIDGVFNHCGAFHKWLDRENLYQNGAFQNPKSPYHDYFYWQEDGTYEGWWGYDNHPKLNVDKSKNLYQTLLDIGKKWVSPPYCADGWRLDVAADLAKAESTNHQFWKDFRSAVKTAQQDALILAEHYGNPDAWLQGDQWDSIMNYDAFMEPISWFFTGISKHSTEYKPELYNDTKIFWQTMKETMKKLPIQSSMVAMNQLSNHDHSRFLTRTNQKTGRLHTDGAEMAEQGTQKAILREAVLFQMTWMGAATIYYGDEAGLAGWTDPDNRRTYPWGNEDMDLIAYHKALIAIRKHSSALRMGATKIFDTPQGVLAYGRFDAKEKMLVLCNNTKEKVKITLPVWEMGMALQAGLQLQIMTDTKGFSQKQQSIEIINGIACFALSPQSAMVWKEV